MSAAPKGESQSGGVAALFPSDVLKPGVQQCKTCSRLVLLGHVLAAVIGEITDRNELGPTLLVAALRRHLLLSDEEECGVCRFTREMNDHKARGRAILTMMAQGDLEVTELLYRTGSYRSVEKSQRLLLNQRMADRSVESVPR